MGWTVVLRHDMPDGSSHLDWFLDPLDEPRPTDLDSRRLLAFRADRSPLSLMLAHSSGGDVVHVTANVPHRVAYLEYEGPVRGGVLGSVTRLDRAWVTVLALDVDSCRLLIGLQPGPASGGAVTVDPLATEWIGNAEESAMLACGGRPWTFRRVC